MREITQEEIDEKVKAHELWWDSDGEHGKKEAGKEWGEC